jgi:hypothetical protein
MNGMEFVMVIIMIYQKLYLFKKEWKKISVKYYHFVNFQEFFVFFKINIQILIGSLFNYVKDHHWMKMNLIDKNNLARQFIRTTKR